MVWSIRGSQILPHLGDRKGEKYGGGNSHLWIAAHQNMAIASTVRDHNVCCGAFFSQGFIHLSSNKAFYHVSCLHVLQENHDKV